MNRGEPADRSGPRLRWVLGCISLLVVVLGFGAFYRYKVSERHFAEATVYMDEVGSRVDTDGCVSEVLAWHGRCQANRPLCDEGIPLVITHCLAARDRSEFCDGVNLEISGKGQWVYSQCEERGTPCAHRKNCACANAFRAIDSFCRHGQEGVAL